MYKAIEDILPRNQKDVKIELEKLSSSVDNVVDFGTNILKWECDKMQSGDEYLIPILFFRNILELADSISILVKNSSVDPAKLLLRTLLENIFGLEYILEKKKKNRALSYNVWLAHRDIKFCEKLDKSSQVGKQLAGELKKDLHVKELEDNKSIVELVKSNSIKILKLPLYESIEFEYQRTKSIIKNPMWYSLFNGPRDTEQLAKRLNHHTLYEIIYRTLSNSVHATDILKGKIVANLNGQTDIIQIRYPKDAQNISVHTLNLLLMTFMNFIPKQLPNKQDDFYAWYKEFRIIYTDLRENELFKIKL